MTSPATQEPCPKCLGYGGSRPVEDGEWVSCSACNGKSQRAELLTQEQLRVHKACVEVINHAPFRQDISELINAARALSDAYAALTQRVEAADKLASVAIHNHSLFYCGKGKCGICNALEAYRALSQEPRNG